jgi:CO/xanthine dehydrogenase FAD-binding subunit
MLLPRFEYRAAQTIREATLLLAEAPDARFMAGGTDLLPQLRTRRKVSRVVDVKRVPELAAIRETDDYWAIGAAVPMAQIASHPGLRAQFPILVECIDEVGAWPLRNRASMGGNICNASPAADTAVALLCLDARVAIAGPSAAEPRTLPVAAFFKGPGQTALGPGELLVEVVLPKVSAGMTGRYLRLSRRRGMDLATVGVLVARKGEKSHRVALAAVAPTPLRVRQAEEALDEHGLSPDSIQKAAQLAVICCSPISDLRGSADYRREMVGVLTARGLTALA